MSQLPHSPTNTSFGAESPMREASPACSPNTSPVVHTSGTQRHRKNSSTGGGRAWSEEEEAYLVETRAHKMPYKHIAAQLKKTELACRLHYHQLSFGGKRRRRATSVSSAASIESRASVPPIDRTRESTPQRQLPAPFTPRSPEESVRSYESNSRTPCNHIPILPKPINHSRAAEQSQPLRLITENIEGFPSKQYIDMERLDKIYDAHRLHFWSMIARSYGCNLSPAVLEDAWRRAHCVSNSNNFLPTPGSSPQNGHAILGAPFTSGPEYGKNFTPVNSSGASGLARSAIERNHQSGLAISTLLTENKEIRSPPDARKFSFSYETR